MKLLRVESDRYRQIVERDLSFPDQAGKNCTEIDGFSTLFSLNHSVSEDA